MDLPTYFVEKGYNFNIFPLVHVSAISIKLVGRHGVIVISCN